MYKDESIDDIKIKMLKNVFDFESSSVVFKIYMFAFKKGAYDIPEG